MLNLTLKDSGSGLEEMISALMVELEKLERPPAQQGLPPGHALPRREQRIADIPVTGSRHRRDRRVRRRDTGRRLSQRGTGGPKVPRDAEDITAIRSLIDALMRACREAGFETTTSGEHAGTGNEL